MKELVKSLVELHAPSGREDSVRTFLQKEIKDLADEVNVSRMGGLHAIVNPGGNQKIMLAAHMDEIGVVVSHIDKDGFARFQPLGGLNARTLVGHRVLFNNGANGIIGIEDELPRTRPPALDRMYIDFGATGSQNPQVKIGDFAAFDRPFIELGDRWVGKSMDDRIGVAVLVEVLRALKSTPNEVQFAFTVQEEVGLRGAQTSAFGLAPDLGIAVDVTRTGDTPKGIKMAVELGAGPAIKVRDSRMISDPRVVDLMVRTAKRRRIPYQLEVLEAGTTDAAAIQLSRAGVPAGCLSIPCRYIHSPSEMVDASDVRYGIRLLTDLVSQDIQL